MKKLGKLTALLLAALMTLSLCACGASQKNAESPAAYNSSAAMDNSKMVSEESYGGFAAMGEETMEAEAVPSPSDSGDAPDIDPEKIIYSASATVETTEFDEACTAISTLIEQYGGWIESSSVNGSNYYNKARGAVYNRSASYQLRVPSDRFTQLMGELSNLGNVPYSYTYTDNITSQYYDVQARLTAYQTQETRLLEMMELAETVSDVITIEDRLTELRYQIENLQTSLKSWDRQVSYSLINLSLEEVQEYTPEATESYWLQLWRSLVEGLKDAMSFIKDAIIFIVGALPVVLIIGLLVWGVVSVIRRLIKARRNRKERKAKAKAEAPADEKKE